jgi:predicted aldo/keto reductase-like oxidoreductase
MIYRRLGRTERQVSLLGVGGGYVMFQEIEAGTAVYQRAYELGVNYFDGRYGYSTIMQSSVIKRNREFFIIGSKTANSTRQGALERIDEDLKELDIDYLDIYYLRAYNHDMIDAYFAPGGAVEGLLEARRKNKIRYLGLAGHSDLSALRRGVETGLIDVVEFPLNIVRREALDILIPTLQKHDTGMVIMKPLNAGLVPAEVGLPWLANQPVHVMIPGMSNIDHLEQDAAILNRDPLALSTEEEAKVESWARLIDQQTCRICVEKCQAVCEPKIIIDWQLYHNIYQNELRRLGVDGFINYPFAAWFKRDAEKTFTNTLANLHTCTQCGKCEEVCPYHLPILSMFKRIMEQQAALLDALKEAGWSTKYQHASSPLPANYLPSSRTVKSKVKD